MVELHGLTAQSTMGMKLGGVVLTTKNAVLCKNMAEEHKLKDEHEGVPPEIDNTSALRVVDRNT